MESIMNAKVMRSRVMKMIPLITMMIWGSMYVASRVVLQSMPALLLLFLRFSISGALLLGIGKMKGLRMIRKEDFKELLVIAFFGYFISNGALLLGIQYSNASFSSLLNALSPILISVFAFFLLKERMNRQQLIALLIAVAGAFMIIGNPGKSVTLTGVALCTASLVLWSFIVIRIKRLTDKYDPIVVTGASMALAAVPALPGALVWMHVTGETAVISPGLLLPLGYVCVVCTAFAHLLWNKALSEEDATRCAAFYPFQPLTSMAMGILFLVEDCSMKFMMGMVLILFSILIRQMHFHHSQLRPAAA